GMTLYAAACVAARGAARFPASPAAGQAVEFLRRAFTEGYGRDRAAADPDLAALRKHPEVVQLLAGPSTSEPRKERPRGVRGARRAASSAALRARLIVAERDK